MNIRQHLNNICLVFFLLGLVLFSTANTGHNSNTEIGSTQNPAFSLYHLDFDNVRKGPYLNLKAALLVNYDNGEVIYSRNADKVRPIASITKLVTAMVVLDSKIDLDLVEKITKDDARRSSKSRLPKGTEWTLHDLLYATLMSSDNRGARALARATLGSTEAFVKEMNAKVKQLGLTKTKFFEPTGLDNRNVSTAHEVAMILHYAYDYDLIREIAAQKTHRAKIVNRKNKHKQLLNTNRLLWSKYDVLGGKTGYIRDSDYCLTSLVKNKEGEELTLVVLGVPGDRLRFREARRLLDWGFRQI